MSDEIVVGACYRDKRDGEIVRVLEVSDPFAPRCVVVCESGKPWVTGTVGYETVREWPRGRWERVPDPTPAVIDEAEPPLAGEMTLRQIEAWRESHGIGEMPLIYIARTGLWHAYAERGHEIVSHAWASDPQDAITAMMAKVTR